MNCPKCSLDNLPYEANCGHCGLPIQSVEAAAGRRKEWNSLTTRDRDEMKERFTRARKRFDNYQSWRVRNKIVHTVIGAVTICFFMTLTLARLHWWILIAGLAFGAAAGYFINRLGGGSFRGLGLFLGAAVLTALPFFGASWIFASMGFAACGGIGYYLGIRLDFGRIEPSFE